MDENELIREAMRLLGRRTSDRKRASSRANAKRPRKKQSKRLANTVPRDLPSNPNELPS